MWELRHISTLWAFTAYYRDGFTAFLPLPNYPRYEDVWGSGGVAPAVLTSVLDESLWRYSRSCLFIPAETSISAVCTGDWLGFRASMDAMVDRKVSCLFRVWNFDSLVSHSVIIFAMPIEISPIV
jgi:hypothetical protein